MSLADAIYGPIKILAVVITLGVCVYIWASFSGVVDSSLLPSIGPAYQADLNRTVTNITAGINTVDYTIPFLVFAMLIVSLIFAFRTGANVVYAPFSIILWLLALVLSAVFTNTYIQVDSTLNMSTTMVISDFLMRNMKWIVLAWLALITVVMFTRTKSETEGGLASAERVFG